MYVCIEVALYTYIGYEIALHILMNVDCRYT